MRSKAQSAFVLPAECAPDSIVLTFPVRREHAGMRLDAFIQSRIPRLSRTRAKEIVQNCSYRPNGTRRKAGERVLQGDTVYLVRPSFAEPEAPQEFETIFEDDEILVIDKPAGLPVHPSASYHKNTLTYLLRKKYGDDPPRIAHRLDKETSGVLICGKTRNSERALKNSFENRRVEKNYLAVVRGRVERDAGTIDLSMDHAREGLHLLMEVRAEGEGVHAQTLYRVMQRNLHNTLVLLEPKTGRQHQLRVHMAALGHPIVGDKLYGPEGVAPFLEIIESGLTEDILSRLGHLRHALHAYELTIEHPTSKQPQTFRAPLAADLRVLCESPNSQHDHHYAQRTIVTHTPTSTRPAL